VENIDTKDLLAKKRRFIFFIILSLNLFGLLMVYESSSMYAYNLFKDPAYFFKKQFIFSLAGLVLFFLILSLNLEELKKNSRVLLLFSIFLLAAVLLLGKKAGGARRWINIFGFNFQISEILKITYLIYCSEYIRRKKHLITNFKVGLLPLFFVLGVICGFLILEPDLGTAVFWVIWTLFFLFLNKASKRHIFLVVLIAFISVFFLIKLYPYRFRRILVFFNPFAEPLTSGYQIIQSQVAFTSGGLFGLGFGESRQKLFFLPAAHTDFIFSIIAEQFGLLGSLFLIFIFFILLNNMFNVAKILNNSNVNILYGIILILFLEILVNIGVTCGLFPTKGLPLPFISYGGSNLITHYILFGLFFNFSRQKDENIISNR